jgi:hypothetical protein
MWTGWSCEQAVGGGSMNGTTKVTGEHWAVRASLVS